MELRFLAYEKLSYLFHFYRTTTVREGEIYKSTIAELKYYYYYFEL